jgi:Flp pilus assembly protein TadG
MPRLKWFLRDQRGSTVVEFAFIAPIMILLYVSMADLTQGLLAQRRVGHVATAVADIVAQKQSWKQSEVTDIFVIGRELMTPMPADKLGIQITSIAIDDKGVARVQWSQANGKGGLTGLGKTIDDDVPGDMLVPNTALVRTDTAYIYDSPLGEALPKGIEFKRRTYVRSRYDVAVERTNN